MNEEDILCAIFCLKFLHLCSKVVWVVFLLLYPGVDFLEDLIICSVSVWKNSSVKPSGFGTLWGEIVNL